MGDNNTIGCGSIIQGCFVIAVMVTLAGGAFVYYQWPKWMKTIDEEAVPWVERKGRVLVGKLSLSPLLHAIEVSDLSDSEKEEWEAFIEEKWEVAYKSEDKLLDRETMIGLARAAVATRSGYIYGLDYARQDNMQETTLNFEQRKLARSLMQKLADGLRDGTYTVEQLEPVRDELLV